jgi:ubiquinone/menaquinone biosynthesis C-methylase UbiE
VPAVLAAADVETGACVLDVATGSGEAAVAALRAVGAAGRVIGADVALAMLAAARARLAAPSFRAVATDGHALPFADGTFDAIVCQLGLQFFGEPLRGLAEFHRVLRPGRRAAVCVVSAPDRAPPWGVLAEALGRHLPTQRELLLLSFSLADPARLERMFVLAGFRDVRVWREVGEGIVESFDDYWAPIEAGTGQLPQAYLSLSESERRAVRNEVRTRLARFAVGGRLAMAVETWIAVGRV